MEPVLAVVLLAVLAPGCLGNSFSFLNRHQSLRADTVTSLLDSLLAQGRYDKRIRPQFGGPPVVVTVNLYIKSMGPVSENDETFSMDCYMRQFWYDDRLTYNKSQTTEFSMNWLFLEKLWKPDTYFVNGRKSTLHKITVPNKFVRLRYDGFLTYSMRLTIASRCPMHLHKFPLDLQACALDIGSYGYSKEDVIYQWSTVDSVTREKTVNLAQYDLVHMNTSERLTRPAFQDKGNMSRLRAVFYLQRHTGYFLLQVYIPCTLIVCCSWVAFWIDAEAVPARITLGVTTVLSMTTLGFGGRSQMPRVSYATALDWYVIICFAFVFASLVEFAVLNFVQRVAKQRRKMAAAAAAAATVDISEVPPTPPTEEPMDVDAPMKPARWQQLRLVARDARRRMARAAAQMKQMRREKMDDDDGGGAGAELHEEGFSRLDLYARKFFPILFAFLNAIYWILFLYYLRDQHEHQQAAPKKKLIGGD